MVCRHRWCVQEPGSISPEACREVWAEAGRWHRGRAVLLWLIEEWILNLHWNFQPLNLLKTNFEKDNTFNFLSVMSQIIGFSLVMLLPPYSSTPPRLKVMCFPYQGLCLTNFEHKAPILLSRHGRQARWASDAGTLLFHLRAAFVTWSLRRWGSRMMSWRENSDWVTSSQDCQKSEVRLTPRMASWINCDEFRILQNLRFNLGLKLYNPGSQHAVQWGTSVIEPWQRYGRELRPKNYDLERKN